MKKRYLKPFIKEDLKDKMVFLSGPRQVGKTTLACSFLQKKEKSKAYFNWDFQEDRKKLLKSKLPYSEKMIVFDEIHKYSRWKNFVKGLYDKKKSDHSFLITGSARLNVYKKGGDSLHGRYYHHRLHPFSLREMNKKPTKSDLEALLEFGGFPEPLYKQNKKHLKRWQTQRQELVIREDIRDFHNLKDLSLIEVLMENISTKIGSPLSVKSLREDLEVAHDTAESWIRILESLFVCFRISPFTKAPKIRSVKKEKKLYLFDWSFLSQNTMIRFENLVACQLLKYCHFLEDTKGEKMELCYLRDTDKREVDFVVTKNKKAFFAVECKTGDKNIHKNIFYFQKRTNIPLFYQVHLKEKDYKKDNIRVLPFSAFCIELNMP